MTIASHMERWADHVHRMGENRWLKIAWQRIKNSTKGNRKEEEQKAKQCVRPWYLAG